MADPSSLSLVPPKGNTTRLNNQAELSSLNIFFVLTDTHNTMIVNPTKPFISVLGVGPRDDWHGRTADTLAMESASDVLGAAFGCSSVMLEKIGSAYLKH